MVTRRLARLLDGRNFYSMLALDHGLTVGFGEGIPKTPFTKVIEACDGLIGGVVLNYGMARSYDRLPKSMALVLQSFGAPLAKPRVQTTTIRHALEMDAAAVAVQINFSDEDLSSKTREISAFTAQAHLAGLPVLFMVGGVHEQDSAEVAKSIRICHELGADLIKVICSTSVLESAENELSEELRWSPPVLIAGGSYDEDLRRIVTRAKSVGFSGFCVGRHIFQSPKPREVVEMLHAIFEQTNERRISK